MLKDSYLKHLRETDREIALAVESELKRQRSCVELIASENYASCAVLEVCGSVLTNKYAEGYPGNRYYGGCDCVDAGEDLAIKRLKDLFGAEYANVQPHSGSQANYAVMHGFLKPYDRILGMDLAHGGHLTHGSSKNYSGTLYRPFSYGVDPEKEIIDYENVLDIAKRVKPAMIIAGASAYSRIIDFERFKRIADEVEALLMVDMAHIAGLIAAELHPNPTSYSDFVTSTTHKTLRGPRGGFILCPAKYGNLVDKAVFPGIQGGPLMHIIAAKAVAFKEAATVEFKSYSKKVIDNAIALSDELQNRGFRIVSGGTDNHIILVDLRGFELNGKQLQEALEAVCISTNKNSIPFDPLPPAKCSGLRLGTPAVTTRGMGHLEMKEIAECIFETASALKKGNSLDDIRRRVQSLTSGFPLYDDLMPEQ